MDTEDCAFEAALCRSGRRIGSALAAEDQRDTFDLDLQHRFSPRTGHDIVWGGSYRITDDTVPHRLLVHMDEIARTTSSLGLFGQDEITLDDDWRLTWDYVWITTSFQAGDAPVRLSWNVAANHTLWSSLSKVARAPSRGEHGLASTFIAGSTSISALWQCAQSGAPPSCWRHQ